MTRRVLCDGALIPSDIPEFYNIAERCCDSWAASDPDRTALIHVGAEGEDNWSFAALKDASDRLASGLRACGVGPGDRVGIYLSQSPQMMIAFLAAWKLGAVALPLFTLFGPDALNFRLSDSGASVLIADGPVDGVPDNIQVVSVQHGGPGPCLADLIASAPALEDPHLTRAEDPAVMIYTSGTTGAPKGVLHAHRFLIGHLPCMETTHAGLPLPDDVGWTPADWAWIGGLMDLAIPCLYYGVRLVSHRMRKFDPADAWALIARLGITRLFLPPTALRRMSGVDLPDGLNVRSIGSGGESLGGDLLAWGRDALGAEINELYGQTECNLVIGSNGAAGIQKPGMLGKAIPGHDVAVLGPEGPVCDQIGEIAVKAPDPAMFLRYWNQPEKTAAKFRGPWMLTGDVGQMDADGYIQFVGRDDDVITSKGYRIGPSEIEACLMRHPAVSQAAVVGIADTNHTERIVAFVVTEGALPQGLDQTLIEKAAKDLSPHMAPRQVIFVEALPMTTTGKVQRKVLRDG